jgi:8-oxo-dGTP pyrophosphatase MutT (NUDIX family)
MTEFVWHSSWPAPEALSVRQVYAWILNDHGCVLLLEMPDGWNLPGGSPEVTDSDWEATLRRESLEEADVTLREIVPLGYQEVRFGDAEPFAQLRAAAQVDDWQDATPDPDNGLVYRRVWVPLDQANDVLGWGESGHVQALAAARIGLNVYGVTNPALTAFASRAA